MSKADHSSSALWQHLLRAVESQEASSPSLPAHRFYLNPVCLCLPRLKWRASLNAPPNPRRSLPIVLKTFPRPYLFVFLQDYSHCLQIAGLETQLPVCGCGWGGVGLILIEINKVTIKSKQCGLFLCIYR